MAAGERDGTRLVFGAMVLADSLTFGELLGLLLIFSPILLLWVFAMVDLFRRHDLAGGWKALWLVAIILLPVFGTLIYFCVRPSGLTAAERAAETAYAEQQGTSREEQLRVLTNLHNAGQLSQDEYEEARGHIAGLAR
jgi:hypothetical protein